MFLSNISSTHCCNHKIVVELAEWTRLSAVVQLVQQIKQMVKWCDILLEGGGGGQTNQR